jgi:gamma-glutamyltranspeptidase/glutathione hydrolase
MTSPMSPPGGGIGGGSRPELLGTFGAVTSTHWLASQAGFAMLERGGTAADAAAAAGFVHQVVEPDMCGPGGDVPIIVAEPDGGVHVVCGQGPAPHTATVAAFRDRGLDLVPGHDVLAAVVPGAFGAWLTLVERWGRLRPRDVLAPALDLAERGFPISASAAQWIRGVAQHLDSNWPTSAQTWLENGRAPAAGTRWRLPVLAATWRRLLAEAEGDGNHSREAECARARDAWHTGFVAEDIGVFCKERDGLLTSDDLAAWRPLVEAPVSTEFRGWTVCKAGPWSQGPVFLQQLRLLDGFALDDADDTDLVHLVTECAKLAFADREAWYADPDFVDVPLTDLLSPSYADERRPLVDIAAANAALRPGRPGGREPVLPAYTAIADDGSSVHLGGTTAEPTLARPGDTCHLDAVDRDGLMVSATPSGGWLQSSPTIPSLGFCLGTRAQMFWLDDVPSRVEPSKRPRTTLTPSVALRDGRPRLAFGTPGGDQQDQWSLLCFLRHALGVTDLQAALDAPAFHSEHMPSSFWPRHARPNRLVVEDRFAPGVIAELRARGHDVSVVDGWSLGRVTAISDERRDGGWLRAASTSRGRQGYAVAR